MRCVIITWLFVFMLILRFSQIGYAQFNIKISSAVSINTILQSKLIVSNNTPMVKQVYFKLRFDEDVNANGAISSYYIIDQGLSEYNIGNVISNLIVPSNANLFCVEMYDVENQVALASDCLILKNSKKASSLDLSKPEGDIILEAGIVNSLAAASVQGKLNVSAYGVPVKLSGFYATSNNTTLITINNNLTLEFDQKKWKEKMINWSSKEIISQKEKILKNVPFDYEQAMSKVGRYQKIIDKTSAGMSDFESSGVIKTLESKSDSTIQDTEQKLEAMKKNVAQEIHSYEQMLKDSIGRSGFNAAAVRDSLSKKVKQREVYTLYEKTQKTVGKLEKMKDSIVLLTSQYKDKYDIYKKYEEEIIQNPMELHALAKRSPQYKKFYKYIQFLSAFKVGNISMPTSKLLANSGRVKGIQSEIRYGGVFIGGFFGTLSQLNFIKSDSLRIDVNKEKISLAGGYLRIEYEELSSSKFIYIKNTGASQLTTNPSFIIGQSTIHAINDKALINFETFWSVSNVVNSAETSIKQVSLLKDMAITSAYSFRGRIINYKFDVDYFGSGFKQFSINNQISNLIRASSSLRFLINKKMDFSINSSAVKNNIWKTANPAYLTLSIGGNITYKPKQMINLTYLFNIGQINSSVYIGKNWTHGFNHFNRFKINKTNIQSQISLLVNSSKGNIDSINYNSFNGMAFLRAEVSKILSFNSTLQYQHSQNISNHQQLVCSAQCGIQMGKSLNFQAGMKYLNANSTHHFNVIADFNFETPNYSLNVVYDPLNVYQFSAIRDFNPNIFQPACKITASHKI